MEECKYKSVLSASQSVNVQEQIQILEENKVKIQNMKFCLNHLYRSILVGSDNTDGGNNGNGNGNDDGENNNDKEDADNEKDSTKNSNNDNDNNNKNHENLTTTIHSHVKHVKQKRFQLALKVFDMHRMDVGEEYQHLTFDQLLILSTTKPTTDGETASTSTSISTSTTKNCSNNHNKDKKKKIDTKSQTRFKRRIHDKQPNGIGKIGGMLLPHAGQELFGPLRHDMLSSSLRLVSSLTNLLARCLGIVLPHPILLRPLLTIPSTSVVGGSSSTNNNNNNSNMAMMKNYYNKKNSSGSTSRSSSNSSSTGRNSSTSSTKSALAAVSKRAISIAAVSTGTITSTIAGTITGRSSSNSSGKSRSSRSSSSDNNNNDDNGNSNLSIEDRIALAQLEQWISQETGDVITSITPQQLLVNDGKGGLINDNNINNVTTMTDLEKLDVEIYNSQNNNKNDKDKDHQPLSSDDDIINIQQGQLNNNEDGLITTPSHHMENNGMNSNSNSSINSNNIATSSSTSSLMSLVGSSSNMLSRSARRAFGKMKGHNTSSGGSGSNSSINNTNKHYNNSNYSEHGMINKFEDRVIGDQNNYNNNNNNKGNANDNGQRVPLLRPMDKTSISHRLKHASYAIICESSKKIQTQHKQPKSNNDVKNQKANSTRTISTTMTSESPLTSSSNSSLVQYELRPPRSSTAIDRKDFDRENERFTIGLQLLQNDIIALSIQAGVPVATLWPAEAMLLNLYSLKLYCLNQCRKLK
jgi:hypothetical protein